MAPAGPSGTSRERELAVAADERRRQGDLEGAASLAEAAGEFSAASKWLEEACVFDRAATLAVRAGEWSRAMRLALLSGDEALAVEVVDALTQAPTAAVRIAQDLEARGRFRWAARLHEAAGDPQAAARAHELAGAVLEAARCHRLAGADPEAARVLEAGLQQPGNEEVAAMRVALGRLYAEHGKFEPALRMLQAVDAGPWRVPALEPMARCLEALGLAEAARAAMAEFVAAGRAGELGPTGGTPSAPLQPDAASSEARQGNERLFGRYDVVRRVAETPHARVLEAIDRVTGERVAVKLLGDSLGAQGRDATVRFAEEARALERLRHPHVVPLREYLPSPPTMVLAWMAGGSLEEMLSREPCSPARAGEIAAAVLDALGAAHRLGIVHRDVKPSNVLFDAGGTPRLADFGAAHLAGAGATMTRAAVGTLAFMAPEQRRGEAASPASDVYAVGALLLDALTGRPPSEALHAEGAGEGGERLRLTHPDLDARHRALLTAFLASSPAARPASAAEARARLLALPWSDRALAVARPTSQSIGEAPAVSVARLGPPLPAPYPEVVAARDEWLDRTVVRVRGDAATRARAALWARSSHPALAIVLRVEPESGELWCEVPRGVPLEEGTLAPAERDVLSAALDELHAAGGWHGAVDGLHVFRGEGEVMLAFPARAIEGSAEQDRVDLLALSRRATRTLPGPGPRG